KSPVMLPIPGTSSLAHLEENMAAAKLQLSPDDWKRIEGAAENAARHAAAVSRFRRRFANPTSREIQVRAAGKVVPPPRTGIALYIVARRSRGLRAPRRAQIQSVDSQFEVIGLSAN